MLKHLCTLFFALALIHPLSADPFQPPISLFEESYYEYTLSFENDDHNELVIYTSLEWVESPIRPDQNYYELKHQDGTRTNKIFFNEFHEVADQACLTEVLDDLLEELYRGISIQDFEIEETDPETSVLRAYLTLQELGHDTSVCITIAVAEQLIYAFVCENTKEQVSLLDVNNLLLNVFLRKM